MGQISPLITHAASKLAWFKSAVVALLGTAVVYALVYFLAPADSYVRALFLERGWLQYATTFFFWFTMATLAFKHAGHLLEERAFRVTRDALEGFTRSGRSTTLIWSDAQLLQREIIDEHLAGLEGSKTVTRIVNALDRLRKTQSTAELNEYFQNRSEVDYGELESGFSIIQYLIWLIPTLGFIGTVMGIGEGISGFAGIIQSAENFKEIQSALPNVTAALGTAFDTTLLALLLSVVAVWYSSFLRKKQEQLLGEIDTLCFDGVVSLFREHSQETAAVISAIDKNVEELCRVLNGNRAAVEAIIHSITMSIQDLLKLIREAKKGIEEGLERSERIALAASENPRLLAEEVRALGAAQRAVGDGIDAHRKSSGDALERVVRAIEENNKLLRALADRGAPGESAASGA